MTILWLSLFNCVNSSEVSDLINSRDIVPLINGDEVTRWWCYLDGEVTMVVITSVWWIVQDALLSQLVQWSWQCPFNTGEVTPLTATSAVDTVPLTLARVTMVVITSAWWIVQNALLSQLAQWSWQCPFKNTCEVTLVAPHCPFNSGEVTMVVMSALYLCDEPYWSRYHFNLPSPSVHVISDGKKENLSLKNFAFLCIICKYCNFLLQKKFAELYNSFWSCSWFAKMFFVKVCEHVC